MKITEFSEIDLFELKKECLENLCSSPIVVLVLEEVNKEINNRMSYYYE